MPTESAAALSTAQLIERFAKKRILLIGDAILDASIHGHALGLSNETPTVVAAEEKTDYSFGGSTLVARNLLELGASVDYVTVLGDDATQEIYRSFSHPRLKNHFITEPGRRCTVKKRFWVDGYKLLQLDVRDDRDISEATIRSLLALLPERMEQADAVVVADNRHGVMADSFIPRLLSTAQNARRKVLVDSQVARRPSNHRLYQGADVVCCNLTEAKALYPTFDPSDPIKGLEIIQKALQSTTIVVKLGAEGCVAWIEGKLYRQPGIAAKEVDPCGAGDAFLSALALSLDLPWPSPLVVANRWAGLSIEISGPNPASLKAFACTDTIPLN